LSDARVAFKAQFCVFAMLLLLIAGN